VKWGAALKQQTASDAKLGMHWQVTFAQPTVSELPWN
jgi:hypothetical protein